MSSVRAIREQTTLSTSSAHGLSSANSARTCSSQTTNAHCSTSTARLARLAASIETTVRRTTEEKIKGKMYTEPRVKTISNPSDVWMKNCPYATRSRRRKALLRRRKALGTSPLVPARKPRETKTLCPNTYS